AWTELPKAELVEWQQRAAQINDWRKWQTGEALKERDEDQPADKNGDYPLKYPLQINPVTTAARIHAFALWGETPDTADPQVRTIVEPKLPEKDAPAG